MNARFFSATRLTAIGDEVQLPQAEAHHFLNVLRGKVGDQIGLLDGCGQEATAEVIVARKSAVTVRVTELRTVDREPRRKLTLAVSLPKGDRQKILVEKLTELGVQRLVPLRTERSVAQPTDGALERLEQHVMAACKQSGRTRKMEIALPLEIAQLATWNQPTVRLVAHPGQGEETALEQIGSDEIAVAVGPEGGFTDEEVAVLVTSGWQALQLGPRLLRIETAAIAVAAKWLL